jgi:hypothetical protein
MAIFIAQQTLVPHTGSRCVCCLEFEMMQNRRYMRLGLRLGRGPQAIPSLCLVGQFFMHSGKIFFRVENLLNLLAQAEKVRISVARLSIGAF